MAMIPAGITTTGSKGGYLDRGKLREADVLEAMDGIGRVGVVEDVTNALSEGLLPLKDVLRRRQNCMR